MTTYTKSDNHMKSQETFTLTKCMNRRLIATNPRPLEKELGKYYGFEDYISMIGEKIKTGKIIT